MRILMVGTGYVGLVSGVCLAECGHEVICADIDEEKIALLKSGKSPIYEPGIEELMAQVVGKQRLSFTSHIEEHLHHTDAVFIAVGTPPGEDGSADLVYVERVASDIAQAVSKPVTVVIKSTVPVGSCERVEKIIHETLKKRQQTFEVPVVSNPEFLKEGNAIQDFLSPDRIVIGTQNDRGKQAMEAVYTSFTKKDPDLLVWLDRRSSELTKYAANAMLATRISFMNELSTLCENAGADIEQIRLGIAKDPRIGPLFLRAGAGYGGSCFPKDVKAMRHLGNLYSTTLGIMDAVHDANERQKNHCYQLISEKFDHLLRGKVIAVWGLSFKPDTDDIREAPALTVVEQLIQAGAQVQAYCPQGSRAFKNEIPDQQGFKVCSDSSQAVKGANALVLMTEWSHFSHPDWDSIATELGVNAPVFDFRNFFDREAVQAAGLDYTGIGKPRLSQTAKAPTTRQKGESYDRTIEPQA